MIIRSLSNSINKQCIIAPSASASGSFPKVSIYQANNVYRCSFSTSNHHHGGNNNNSNQDHQHHREFSSLALPLAKTTNGIVNVKSMNIPRPRQVLKTVGPLTKPKREDGKKKKRSAVNGLNGEVFLKEEQVQETSMDAMMNNVVRREESPSHISYVGNSKMPITSELKLVLPEDDTPRGIWPVFRMMDEDGHFRQDIEDANLQTSLSQPFKHDLDQLRTTLVSQNPHFSQEIESCTILHLSKNAYPDMPQDKPQEQQESTYASVSTSNITKNTLLRAHRQMIRLRTMDTILHNAQRQGRISFYMTNHGEESIHIGSSSALHPQDHVFAQYREAGVLMWRGFTLEQFCNQCFSNELDLGRGRQMPVHYGCRALNYQTISSPLGTQITQAVGAAYKLKLDKIASPDTVDAGIAIAYFGDGAASSIDFHSACNFAATLGAPVIFFCRNNGYAISTPVSDQYAGDGIVSRAPGYGMAGIRVDGNDVFAVHAAVQKAREYALENNAPVMIEAMTYRQGHHSTSDDSSRYRDTDEVQNAMDVSDPIVRMDRFLKRYGWMNESEVASIEDEERMAVLKAMEGAEMRKDPSLDTMFEDVYFEKPPHLVRQEVGLRDHLKRHGVQFH